MLLVPSIFAGDSPSGFEIVGNTVRWENSKGSLVVWPHTSTGFTEHVQYANITSYEDGTYDFAFEFENAITGKLFLWQNMSHNISVDDIGNITHYQDCPGESGVNYGFINSSWGWCNYTNASSEIYWEHYLEWYNTNASGIRIFWNTTRIIGSHYEEQYFFDWNDKTALFEHTIYNGNHFYWIKDVDFQEDETKQVRWEYSTPINSKGKWELWIKRTEDTIGEALASGNYVKLDPWWDSDYEYRYEIYSNATGIYSINVNDTYAPNIWTLNASSADDETKYLYCKVSGCASGDRAIGNTTDETPWENASSRTGHNPTYVWPDYGFMLHFDNATGTVTEDSSATGNDFDFVDTPVRTTDCIFGGCLDFDDNGPDYLESTITLVGEFSVSAWAYPDDGGSDSIMGDAGSTWNDISFYFGISGDDIELYVSAGGGDKTSCLTTDNSILAGRWHHLGFTVSETNNQIKIYANGTLRNTCAYTGTITKTASDPFYVGRRFSTQYWDGRIDEVNYVEEVKPESWFSAQYYNGINNLTTLGAEHTEAVGGMLFVSPTPDNATYQGFNYVEVNVSINENATTCSLEWDDGTPANESMTIYNADENTVCWINMTGLSDGEFLFTAYAILIESGNNAIGERNITIDTTEPTITITSPVGMITSTEVEINYTATDTGDNIDSCWYFYGGANTTMASCANATITITTAGSGTIIVYANDTLGNTNSTPTSFTMILLNLVVYNATDNATITDWHIYMLNGSSDNYSSFTNNNTLALNISDVPTGETEMTVWKSGYGNNTYNFTSQGITSLSFARHIIADTFLINITPGNNSIYFTGEAFLMNISLPNYADGNASIWYSLNSSGYTLGCTECTEYSTDVSFSFGQNTINALINGSTHYTGVDNENKTISIIIYTAKYNISFFDEMTNKSINFSANKNGTLRVFCTEVTLADQLVTDTLYNFIVNCTGTLDYIQFKLYDPKGDHYRTLMPSIQQGNITFYMINTTPADVTLNKVTFTVTDSSMRYNDGIMHFRKIILGEGLKDIIDTNIGTDGNVYAALIGGEIYTLTVESSDGTNSKTLGEYPTPDTTATIQPLTIIDIRFIPTIYNYIGTDVSWEMQFNTTTGRIYFYWNDSTGETNSIKFWIYNATNVSAWTQMYYDTVSGKSNHLFQWDYVTNGNENDTYVGYFEVDHAIHGNITESRTLMKGGIFFQWLGNIGGWYHIIAMVILVFIASIFGAKSAPIGGVILAIVAGFLFYIEWLPAIMAGNVRLTDLLMVGLIAMAVLSMFIIRRRRV